MKTRILNILTIVLYLTLGKSMLAQNNWAIRNPKLGPNGLVAILMEDTGKGIAVGSNLRTSARTINGGKYWSSLALSPTDDFNYSYFSPVPGNKHSFRVSGSPGRLVKIAANGLVTIGAQTPFANHYGLAFYDSLNGYAFTADNPALLYHTSNGGTNWNVRTTTIQTNYIDPAVTSRTQTEVWMFVGSKVWKSSNSGILWDSVSIPGLQIPNFFKGNIHWINPQLGFISVDSGRYFRSTNGGTSWSPGRINNYIQSNGFQDVQFQNSEVGYTIAGGQLFRTQNGGQTWVQKSPPIPHGIDAITVLPSGSIFISLGNSGSISRSDDGGETWRYFTNEVLDGFNGIEFQSKNRVWVWSDFNVVKSVNSGKTWEKVSFPGQSQITGIQFVNPAVGFVSTFTKIYKTINGGATWQTISPGGSLTNVQFMAKVKFFSPDTGYCFVPNGIHRTVDGGNTWQVIQNSVPFFSQRDFYFSSPTHWLGFGQDANFLVRMYATTNGGQSWTETEFASGGLSSGASQVNLFGSNSGYFLYYFQSLFGSDFYSGLYRIINGGTQAYRISDHPIFLGSSSTVISFYDEFTGYAFNQNRFIYKTSDGGSSWIKTDSIQFFPGNKIGCLEGRPVILAGGGGGITTSNNWTGTDNFVIEGKVQLEQDNNCLPNQTEPGLSNRVVIAEPGPYFASTDSTGKFVLDVDLGNFQLSQQLVSIAPIVLESQFCPQASPFLSVEVNGLIDTLLGGKFSNVIRNCSALKLTASHQPLRPCRISFMNVRVQNLGNLASDSEYVHIRFPAGLFLSSSSISYSYQPVDSTYRFKIGPLQPGESVYFQVKDSVACDPNSLTGQTLCIKATIPNVPPCLLQSPNWDGADLEVASRCQNGQTKFTLHNKGTAMATTSQYQIFIDSALVYQAPFQLGANGSMSVTLPTNAPAGFARMVVPQSANHPLSSFAAAEANCATGFSTNGLFPPPDQSPLVDIECVTVTNAYDPNDKTVYPKGWGTSGNVEPETEFTYKIRFQNTGTDTAFKVVLVDTLDEDLDIASMQIGAASHPFTFKVSGKGRPVFTWTFDNILLPDSNTNQLASNGFVSYSIRPKAGLALGTRLENFADIYFDFNDPIRTNTTVNTLWQPTYTPGILDTVFVTATKKPMAERDLSVYPNPTKGKLEVNVPEAGVLQVYNTKGEAVLTTQLEVGKQSLNFSQLPKGLYLIQFRSPEGQICKKVILE